MNIFVPFLGRKMGMVNFYELSAHQICHHFCFCDCCLLPTFIQYASFIHAHPLLNHKHDSIFWASYLCKLLLPLQQWCVLYSKKTLLLYCLWFDQRVFRFIAISRMVQIKLPPNFPSLIWFIMPHSCVYLKTLFKKAQHVKQYKIYKTSF